MNTVGELPFCHPTYLKGHTRMIATNITPVPVFIDVPTGPVAGQPPEPPPVANTKRFSGNFLLFRKNGNGLSVRATVTSVGRHASGIPPSRRQKQRRNGCSRSSRFDVRRDSGSRSREAEAVRGHQWLTR